MHALHYGILSNLPILSGAQGGGWQEKSLYYDQLLHLQECQVWYPSAELQAVPALCN